MKLSEFLSGIGLLFCLASMLYPTRSLAQIHSYPVNSRAVFLTGCLLDDPPNFQRDLEVNNVMKMCVCMLDKFQDNYTNLEFIRMFAGADKGEQPYKDELNKFAERHILECL